MLRAGIDLTEQQQARGALEDAGTRLKRSEAEFRTIIDAIPTQVWCALPDGRADYQNRTWLEYTGVTPDQTSGTGWHVVIHPEDLAGYARWWDRTWRAEQPGEAEARFRRHDGEYRWFLTRVVPLRSEAGRILKWYGTNTDIEGRKRAEFELRRSEAFLAQAQRVTLTGSIWWKVSTGEIVWSEESYRLMGYARSVKPTLELILQRCHPDDLALVQETIARSASAGADMNFEHRLLLPDGLVRHVHVVLQNLRADSGDDEFVGAVSDITARKESQEALRRSEQLARGQVEALIQNLDVLASGPGADDYIVKMLATIGRLLDARWVALWMLDQPHDRMVVKAAIRGGIPVAADPENPFIKNPSSWKHDRGLQELFRTRAPVVCEDIDTDERVLNSIREFFKAHGTKKFLRVPTLVGGEVKGFIAIHHGERGPYRADEIDLAQALAHQAMLAVQMREAATVEERNRLARDIHDTLAQGFTAVIIQLEAADDARERGLGTELAQHLQSARELARESLNEARRSVRALRPRALENGTLCEALQRLVTKVTAGTALRTSFESLGQPRELPPLWQEHLLHICQEALTNTLKHARASRFDTRLHFTDTHVRLELADDGVGFALRERYDGSGLLGMRERVEQIGAEIEVDSSPTGGTRLLVAAPFSHNGFA